MRLWRTGDVNRGRPDYETRLFTKIDFDGPLPQLCPDLGPCWLWQGHIDRTGYGTFKGHGTFRPYVAVYEWVFGSKGVGMQLDHLCRVPACVNPFHCEPVTRSENIRRAVPFGTIGKANREKTICKWGHALTPENVYMHKDRRQCRECRYRRSKEGYTRSARHQKALSDGTARTHATSLGSVFARS